MTRKVQAYGIAIVEGDDIAAIDAVIDSIPELDGVLDTDS